MEKNLRIDALHDLPIWLVIFPEGTGNIYRGTPYLIETEFMPWVFAVICNDTQQKTRAYAKKADLTDDPTYVLHPKSTGLFHACQYLYPKVTNIYDVTMAFSDVPPNTHAFDSYSPIGIFMFNRRPPKVFINIKKHSFSNVPGLGDSIEQSSTTQSPNTTNSISSVEPEFQARLDVFTSWLRRQFMIKDDLLKEFHLKSSKFLGTEPSRSFNVIPNWRDWFGIFITSITSLLISSNLLFLYTLNKKWAGF